MAGDDSDSSEDAYNDVETNVLLGYAVSEETVDSFSQLGGQPVSLSVSHRNTPLRVAHERGGEDAAEEDGALDVGGRRHGPGRCAGEMPGVSGTNELAAPTAWQPPRKIPRT